MVKRVLIDVVIGAGLAFFAQILQYGAYLIGLLVGLPFSYDTAPVDPASSPGWNTQVNLLFLLSAPLVLALTFAVAWVLKVQGVSVGVRRGVIWAAVALVWMLLVGVGNGTLAMFTTLGVWAYFVAVALGPILVGWLRRDLQRAEPEAMPETRIRGW